MLKKTSKYLQKSALDRYLSFFDGNISLGQINFDWYSWNKHTKYEIHLTNQLCYKNNLKNLDFSSQKLAEMSSKIQDECDKHIEKVKNDYQIIIQDKDKRIQELEIQMQIHNQNESK